MKIVFVIPTLMGGGAERASVLLAQGLLDLGHEISFLTFDRKENDAYSLDRRIKRVELNLMGKAPTIFHAIGNNLKRIFALRRGVLQEKPDVVVSVMYRNNVSCVLALLGSGVKLVGNEQVDTRNYSIGIGWEFLRRITYFLLDQLVSVSRGVDESFKFLSKQKRIVIYNPLFFEEHSGGVPSEMDQSKKWLIAAGRFTAQKGFDWLIQIFDEIKDEFSDWNLIILGDGELRGELEGMVKERNLGARVLLPGRKPNVLDYFKAADIFVLSSRFEGFGNVLIEAMACGLPVAAFNCPSGPAEIIRSEEDGGILVPNGDVEALKNTVSTLMRNEEKRRELAARAMKVKERFGQEKIVQAWDSLLKEVVR